MHPHHQHSHPLDKASKDWQEGLRALLPNVNFGTMPNNQSDGFQVAILGTGLDRNVFGLKIFK
jgi:hypothetical protein